MKITDSLQVFVYYNLNILDNKKAENDSQIGKYISTELPSQNLFLILLLSHPQYDEFSI
jgi:hypothetical protein